jgi:hypothetical protein
MCVKTIPASCAAAKIQSVFGNSMNVKNSLATGIFLAALIGMIFLLFNVPVGMDPKRFGGLVFGAILVFGAVNLVFVLLEARQTKSDEDQRP